jgi:hypothetical protein
MFGVVAITPIRESVFPLFKNSGLLRNHVCLLYNCTQNPGLFPEDLLPTRPAFLRKVFSWLQYFLSFAFFECEQYALAECVGQEEAICEVKTVEVKLPRLLR